MLRFEIMILAQFIVLFNSMHSGCHVVVTNCHKRIYVDRNDISSWMCINYSIHNQLSRLSQGGPITIINNDLLIQ